MAYNEKLARRVREIIAATEDKIGEKKMFGALCYMVNDKMCVCVQKENLMLRINPGIYDELLQKEGCKPMEFGGRTMTGFVYVDEAAVNSKKKMEHWVKLALDYNKIVKTSKNKKAKPS